MWDIYIQYDDSETIVRNFGGDAIYGMFNHAIHIEIRVSWYGDNCPYVPRVPHSPDKDEKAAISRKKLHDVVNLTYQSTEDWQSGLKAVTDAIEGTHRLILHPKSQWAFGGTPHKPITRKILDHEWVNPLDRALQAYEKTE